MSVLTIFIHNNTLNRVLPPPSIPPRRQGRRRHRTLLCNDVLVLVALRGGAPPPGPGGADAEKRFRDGSSAVPKPIILRLPLTWWPEVSNGMKTSEEAFFISTS